MTSDTMQYGLSNDILASMKSVFQQNELIQQVILFGSRAMGNYREASDIDLAIVAEHFSYDALLTVSVQLTELNLPYLVDLIDYNKLTESDFKNHIDRKGILLYNKQKITQKHSIRYTAHIPE